MAGDIYLGIDQSYSGFAMTSYDASSGMHETVVKAFPAAKFGTGAGRLVEIQDHLRVWLGAHRIHPIAAVGMEGYAFGARNGREQAGELGAAVKLALHGEGLDPVIVAPTAVKKFVTGKGNAKKNEMLLQVFKRWNVEFKDDNAADSYSIARIVAALHEPGELLKSQQEVIDSLK